MCIFCKPFTGDVKNPADRRQVDFFDGDSNNEMFLTESIDDEHYWFLSIIDKESGTSDTTCQINFCPICGRKL